jgi:ribonuclease HI
MEVNIYIKIFFTGHLSKGKGIYYIILEFITSEGEPATLEFVEGFQPITKNRTALKACIKAMSRLTKRCLVNIHINNRHVTETINQGWFFKWNFEDWTHNGEPIKNADLWQQLFKFFDEYNTKLFFEETNQYTAYMENQSKHEEIVYQEDKMNV